MMDHKFQRHVLKALMKLTFNSTVWNYHRYSFLHSPRSHMVEHDQLDDCPHGLVFMLQEKRTEMLSLVKSPNGNIVVIKCNT